MSDVSNIQKGDRVRVSPDGGPYPVADVGAYGPDRFVDAWVSGHKARLPAAWCEPVPRPTLVTRIANMIEDAGDQYEATAREVIRLCADRIGGGLPLAAAALAKMADER